VGMAAAGVEQGLPIIPASITTKSIIGNNVGLTRANPGQIRWSYVRRSLPRLSGRNAKPSDMMQGLEGAERGEETPLEDRPLQLPGILPRLGSRARFSARHFGSLSVERPGQKPVHHERRQAVANNVQTRLSDREEVTLVDKSPGHASLSKLLKASAASGTDPWLAALQVAAMQNMESADGDSDRDSSSADSISTSGKRRLPNPLVQRASLSPRRVTRFVPKEEMIVGHVDEREMSKGASSPRKPRRAVVLPKALSDKGRLTGMSAKTQEADTTAALDKRALMVRNARNINSILRRSGDEATRCHERWVKAKKPRRQDQNSTDVECEVAGTEAADARAKLIVTRLRQRRRDHVISRLTGADVTSRPGRLHIGKLPSTSELPSLQEVGSADVALLAVEEDVEIKSKNVTFVPNRTGSADSNPSSVPSSSSSMSSGTVDQSNSGAEQDDSDGSKSSGESDASDVSMIPAHELLRQTTNKKKQIYYKTAPSRIEGQERLVAPTPDIFRKSPNTTIRSYARKREPTDFRRAAVLANQLALLARQGVNFKKLPEVPRLQSRFRDGRHILKGEFRNQVFTFRHYHQQVARSLCLSPGDWAPKHLYELDVVYLEHVAQMRCNSHMQRSAETIQRAWRMSWATRHARLFREEVMAAIRRIQRWWRFMLVWRLPLYLACLRRPLMLRAICRVQAMFRMWSTRRRLKVLLELYHIQWEMRRLMDSLGAQDLDRTILFVTRLQAAIRGFLYRKQAREQQQSSLQQKSTLAAGTLQPAEGLPSERSVADPLTSSMVLPITRRSSFVGGSVVGIRQPSPLRSGRRASEILPSPVRAVAQSWRPAESLPQGGGQHSDNRAKSIARMALSYMADRPEVAHNGIHGGRRSRTTLGQRISMTPLVTSMCRRPLNAGSTHMAGLRSLSVAKCKFPRDVCHGGHNRGVANNQRIGRRGAVIIRRESSIGEELIDIATGGRHMQSAEPMEPHLEFESEPDCVVR